MINFQELEKVAEFKNGELNWLEGRDINAVYVILVGDEYYIGSSHYTYLRIGQHLNELLKGDHHSCKLQEKFNQVRGFEVYSLDRGIEKTKLKNTEFEYIKKFQPSLNVSLMTKKDGKYKKPETLGERVKCLLKERGITMSELASIIGTTQTSISRMFGENGNPTYNTLIKVSEALGIEIRELFAEEPTDTIRCPKCGARFVLDEKEE